MWFEFITNTECNWNCTYCAFDRVPNVTMTFESINRHQYIFDFMKKAEDKTIVVEGGEIGLIKDNILLKELFAKFDQNVIINTNGTFFDDDRSSLYPFIDKIFYHVVPDAKTLFRVKRLNVPFEVVYGIVDDDYEALFDFITYNEHLDFGYVSYESGKIDTSLETPELFHQRIMCSTMNPFVSIDLAREVLCMCSARGCHVTVPLTKENFENMLTGFSNFKEHNDMCDTCYRMCKSSSFEDIMSNKKEMRKLL